MARITLLILFLLSYFAITATAGQRVLALQSIPVLPYEEATKGYEKVTGAEIERLFIAGMNEKDVLERIKASQPSMLLAVGRDGLKAVRKISDLPIIYCMVFNPHALLSGEKNIAGISMNLPPNRQLSELIKVLPKIVNIGILYDPEKSGDFVQNLREASAKKGIKLTNIVVRHAKDAPRLLSELKGRIDIFWMLPDTTVITPETLESFLLFSMEAKVPLLTFSDKYLELGAMLSIGIDPYDIGFQAGELAQKVLSNKRIENGKHLDARKAIIIINQKVAGKLGVKIDQKFLKNNMRR